MRSKGRLQGGRGRNGYLHTSHRRYFGGHSSSRLARLHMHTRWGSPWGAPGINMPCYNATGPHTQTGCRENGSRQTKDYIHRTERRDTDPCPVTHAFSMWTREIIYNWCFIHVQALLITASMDRVFRAKDSSSTKTTPWKIYKSRLQIICKNLSQSSPINATFFSKDCFLEKWEELQVTWSAAIP